MSGPHVLFLGDYQLVGFGAETGWVDRVLKSCAEAELILSTWKRGAPADTSFDLVNRWTYETPASVKEAPDPRIVLAFGANDAAPTPGRVARVRDRRSVKHLGLMLDEMIEARINVFVVGPAPVGDSEHRQRIQELSERFAPVCAERQVPYLPVFDELLDSADWTAGFEAGNGAHPGPAGYEALAEFLVKAGLIDWLSRPVTLEQGLPSRRGGETPSRATASGYES